MLSVAEESILAEKISSSGFCPRVELYLYRTCRCGIRYTSRIVELSMPTAPTYSYVEFRVAMQVRHCVGRVEYASVYVGYQVEVC